MNAHAPVQNQNANKQQQPNADALKADALNKNAAEKKNPGVPGSTQGGAQDAQNKRFAKSEEQNSDLEDREEKDIEACGTKNRGNC